MDSDDEEFNPLNDFKYTKDAKVGEGTYAVVYRGTCVQSGRRVAIKKIKMGQFKDGLDLTAIREVKYLQELRHPNIIELIDVFSQKTNLNLVLEYLDTDLEQVIKDKSLLFMPADIKSWMMMMLRGLDHCHRHFILHRDMKPNNLLITKEGQLKIADFGLARDWGDPNRQMTSEVVTRWYRSPELLLGAKEYSYAVDIWAVGCIFAELMLRTPYVAGESDMDQLTKIFHALGTPTEHEWPGLSTLPGYVPFKHFPKVPLRQYFTAAGADALSLLEQMLVFDPNKRWTAEECLGHSYFRNAPLPTTPEKLPKPKIVMETETPPNDISNPNTLKRKLPPSTSTVSSNSNRTEDVPNKKQAT
ncbi:kinase-like domain-containing protein [Mycotypha africana]|uniref:kinase-like domain-containing protein n=1 Tax=Mycotypha africana TaxID=64632 RepID=UPI002300984A|nr:kinase-like domain-containing protein [Mycotypha africana]KAI8970191.1 kinase-like domain-containing protein [Mycotypha africana]